MRKRRRQGVTKKLPNDVPRMIRKLIPQNRGLERRLQLCRDRIRIFNRDGGLLRLDVPAQRGRGVRLVLVQKVREARVQRRVADDEVQVVEREEPVGEDLDVCVRDAGRRGFEVVLRARGDCDCAQAPAAQARSSVLGIRCAVCGGVCELVRVQVVVVWVVEDWVWRDGGTGRVGHYGWEMRTGF